MDAMLPGQLSVVVVRRVQRLMGILNVMSGDSGEQHGLDSGKRGVAAERLHRAAEVAEFLGLAPRQQAVAFQGRHPEFFERRVVFARQLLERIIAVLFHAEVDEMIRIFIPPDAAPQVGVEHAHDEFVAIRLEERFDRRRQQFDRPPHDVAVRRNAPRVRR